ncbi:hypothetical protein CKR_1714 [Clostridium kluyveri NBRC 12016]|uniref:Uncharacterized protein n=1 Tax=Clostridium kluyveri (strain NBRC 12016) TaxID=583346 RepID=B9E2P0_CLOK1|nr:hypothetical protein CKR_1714 [Clostridium kluyveri NBRC 12016]
MERVNLLDKEILELLKSMQKDIKDVNDKVNNLSEGQNNLTNEVSSLKGEVRKNSIKLESIEKKIDIIAEVQTAHKEQDVRGFQGISNSIKDKDSLISSAVKDISKDVKELKQGQDEIKEDIKKVKIATGNNCIEIEYLKATK